MKASLCLLFLISTNVFGQGDGWNPIRQDNVYTPKGSSITAYLMNENSTYIRQYYDQSYSGPNRTLLYYFPGQPSSTALFNCHGYAWDAYEGGTPHFIGLYSTTDEDPYMTDGSYIKVCGPVYPGKVSWGSSDGSVADHSAVTTSNPNRWVSKWNRFVFVEHDPSDTPYNTNQTVYNYYSNALVKANTNYTINCNDVGPDQNFSVGHSLELGASSGINYNWTTYGNLQQVSATNNSNSFTVRGSSLPGVGTVQVSVTSACDGRTITSLKKIHFGAGGIGGTYSYGYSTYNVEGSTGIAVSSSSNTIYFNLTNPWDQNPNTRYSWTVNSQSGNVSRNLSGKAGSITLGGGSYCNVTCTVNTPCGNSIPVSFNCYNYSGFRMVAYPNPVNSELTISAVKSSDSDNFDSPNVASESAITDNSELTDVDVDVRLVDANNQTIKSGKLNKGQFKIPVSKLPNGIYYLRMSLGNKKVDKQIMIQH